MCAFYHVRVLSDSLRLANLQHGSTAHQLPGELSTQIRNLVTTQPGSLEIQTTDATVSGKNNTYFGGSSLWEEEHPSEEVACPSGDALWGVSVYWGYPGAGFLWQGGNITGCLV